MKLLTADLAGLVGVLGSDDLNGSGLQPPGMNTGATGRFKLYANQDGAGSSAPGSVRLSAARLNVPQVGRITVSQPVIETALKTGVRTGVLWVIVGSTNASVRFSGWASPTEGPIFTAIYDFTTEQWGAVDATGAIFVFEPAVDDTLAGKLVRKTGTGIDKAHSFVGHDEKDDPDVPVLLPLTQSQKADGDGSLINRVFADVTPIDTTLPQNQDFLEYQFEITRSDLPAVDRHKSVNPHWHWDVPDGVSISVVARSLDNLLNKSDWSAPQTLTAGKKVVAHTPPGMHVGGGGKMKLVKNKGSTGAAADGDIQIIAKRVNVPNVGRIAISQTVVITPLSIFAGLTGIYWVVLAPSTASIFLADYNWANQAWSTVDPTTGALTVLDETTDDFTILARVTRKSAASSGIEKLNSFVGHDVRSDAPSPITSGSVTPTTKKIVLQAVLPDDSDIAFVVFLRSLTSNLADAVEIDRRKGSKSTDDLPTIGTAYWYWAYTIDKDGNSSTPFALGTTSATPVGDGDLDQTPPANPSSAATLSQSLFVNPDGGVQLRLQASIATPSDATRILFALQRSGGSFDTQVTDATTTTTTFTWVVGVGEVCVVKYKSIGPLNKKSAAYSPTATKTITGDTTAPGPATSLTYRAKPKGMLYKGVAPTDANTGALLFYRGTTATASAATLIGGILCKPGHKFKFLDDDDDLMTLGTPYFGFVAAVNTSDYPPAPTRTATTPASAVFTNTKTTDIQSAAGVPLGDAPLLNSYIGSQATGVVAKSSVEDGDLGTWTGSGLSIQSGWTGRPFTKSFALDGQDSAEGVWQTCAPGDSFFGRAFIRTAASVYAGALAIEFQDASSTRLAVTSLITIPAGQEFTATPLTSSAPVVAPANAVRCRARGQHGAPTAGTGSFLYFALPQIFQHEVGADTTGNHDAKGQKIDASAPTTDSAPSVYRAMGVCSRREEKSAVALSVTGSTDTTAVLDTHIPSVSTSVAIKQRLYADDGTFKRHSTSETAWSTWKPLFDSDQKPAYGTDLTGIPAALADINPTEGGKLGGIATGATKNVTYRQTTAPTGGTYTTGDTWIDTSSSPRVHYMWTGSAWEAVGRNTTLTTHLSDAGKLATLNPEDLTDTRVYASASTLTLVPGVDLVNQSMSGVSFPPDVIISRTGATRGDTFCITNAFTGSGLDVSVSDNVLAAVMTSIPVGCRTDFWFNGSNWQFTTRFVGLNFGGFIEPSILPAVAALTNQSQTFTAAQTFSANTSFAAVPRPTSDATVDLGTPSARWNNVRASTATIVTSDGRYKQDVAPLDDAALDAIGKVGLSTYRLIASVQADGDAARYHFGVISQQVLAAFADAGLDARRYSFWCEDDLTDDVTAEDGSISTVTRTDGSGAPLTIQGIRYEEFLIAFSAYQARELGLLAARVAALEAA